MPRVVPFPTAAAAIHRSHAGVNVNFKAMIGGFQSLTLHLSLAN